MKRIILAIGLAVFLAALLTCAKREVARQTRQAGQTGAVSVVTTNFPPFDFVRAIIAGGSGAKSAAVNLTMLLPPGAESHSFEPTPRDIITVQNCDVFIYTGGESDVWVDRILESMDTSKMKIIRMMDAVDVVEEEIVEGMQEEPEEGDEEEAEYDEHVWTSPQNAKRIVQTIANALCEVDSNNAALYRGNAQAYCAELDALDAEFAAIVRNAKRKTLVFGDRFPFRYFADAYSLTYFAAFPGCSTETEASAATVAFLIDKIKAEKIPVVFHIELANEKMADTIAAETGATNRLLHSVHNVSRKDFEDGKTYLDFMRANAETVREALN